MVIRTGIVMLSFLGSCVVPYAGSELQDPETPGLEIQRPKTQRPGTRGTETIDLDVFFDAEMAEVIASLLTDLAPLNATGPVVIKAGSGSTIVVTGSEAQREELLDQVYQLCEKDRESFGVATPELRGEMRWCLDQMGNPEGWRMSSSGRGDLHHRGGHFPVPEIHITDGELWLCGRSQELKEVRDWRQKFAEWGRARWWW